MEDSDDYSEQGKLLEYMERINSAPLDLDIPTSARPIKNMRSGLTEAGMARYIRLYAISGNVTRSAQAIGVTRKTIYRRMEVDEDFRNACDMARGEYLFTLEREIYRRGVVGVLTPVYHAGRIVGYVREYDDKLLLALMKAKNPEEYDRRALARELERDKLVAGSRTGIARMPALTTRETTTLPIETVDE